MAEEKEKLESFGVTAEESGAFNGNMVPFIYKSLEYNNLRSLAIKGFEGGFKLNDSHVISLTMAILKADIQLVDLLLTYHLITDVGLEEISRLFKPDSDGGSSRHNAPFEGLDLEGNEITGSCFDAINLASGYACSLVVFNISSNPLSKEGRHCIANAVAKNKTLRQLSINRYKYANALQCFAKRWTGMQRFAKLFSTVQSFAMLFCTVKFSVVLCALWWL
jgi:hypothetical protein